MCVCVCVCGFTLICSRIREYSNSCQRSTALIFGKGLFSCNRDAYSRVVVVLVSPSTYVSNMFHFP